MHPKSRKGAQNMLWMFALRAHPLNRPCDPHTFDIVLRSQRSIVECLRVKNNFAHACLDKLRLVHTTPYRI
eukprot:2097419-Alexandrium_andersonii.AAC.1